MVIKNFFTPTMGERETRLWRVISLIVVGFLWSLLGVLLTAIIFAVKPEPREPWLDLLGNSVAFVPLLILCLFVPLVHKRKALTIFSVTGKIRGNLIFVGILSWGILLIFESLFKFLLNPNDFRVTLNFKEFIPTFLIAIIFISIQATSEELLFRSLIPQALGGFFRNPYAIIAISGMLFGLPHLSNPEANSQIFVSLIGYTLTGIGWGWATYKSGGLELAIGAHIVNNIYALTIVGYDNSAVSASSILKTNELNMTLSTISSLIMLSVWIAILGRNDWAIVQANSSDESLEAS